MLDLNDETDDLTLVERAVVVPPAGAGRLQTCGVLDERGVIVANSLNWSGPNEPVNSAPDMPGDGQIADLPGTYMFGGISYGHFGHFIAESMARIWALDVLRGKIDGILFIPKQQGPNSAGVLDTYRKLTEALGVDVPCFVQADPVRVSQLYVPRQGFGIKSLTTGSRKFRDYINRHAAADVAPEGAGKIYISRSKLPPQRGGILGEAKLEKYLIDEGYAIYHPQLESQTGQLAQYKAADMIISVDCSPLHLVGFVGHAGQRVGIIERRDMALGADFVRQLTLFKDIQAVEIRALLNDWLPGNTNRPSRSSFGEVRFSEMYRQFKDAGLIRGETPWTDLTESERAAELARIEVSHKLRFKPHRPDTTY